jgi:two-component system, NtrC family, sensor kinase
VHEGLDSTLLLAKNLLKNRVEIRKDFGEVPKISCSLSQINQVIQDNGNSISAEALPKIFDPFFATKATGQGMGMGMSISFKILVDTEPSAGKALSILLPVRPQQALRRALQGAVLAARHKKKNSGDETTQGKPCVLLSTTKSGSSTRCV